MPHVNALLWTYVGLPCFIYACFFYSFSTVALPRPNAVLDAAASASSSLAALGPLSLELENLSSIRLDANMREATTRTSATLCTVVAAVQQCVPAFVHTARQRLRASSKRLGWIEEEFNDTIDTLKIYLQASIAVDGSSFSVSEDALYAIEQLIARDVLPSISTVLAHDALDEALQRINAASYIQRSADPGRCTVSHSRWLRRELPNAVTFTVSDALGQPVSNMTASDIWLSLNVSVGWTATLLSVEGNVVTLDVTLTAEASDEAGLLLVVGEASITHRLQVCSALLIYMLPVLSVVVHALLHALGLHRRHAFLP